MAEVILYDTHLHTPLCRHSEGEPTAYAEAAEKRGLTGVTFTCHNPLPDGLSQGSRMYPADWEVYLELIAATREEWTGRVDVLLGVECDYWPGLENFLEKQISANPLHYVLGSVHPHVEDYRANFWQDDVVEYMKLYFTHLAQAAETGLFDCLSHPDIIRTIYPKSWQRERDNIWSHISTMLDRIAKTGIAMELNTSGAHKKNSIVMNPEPTLLVAMCERGIPVVVGSDSHKPGRVGEGFEEAFETLNKAGYREINFFIERQRQTVSIEDAREKLLSAANGHKITNNETLKSKE